VGLVFLILTLLHAVICIEEPIDLVLDRVVSALDAIAKTLEKHQKVALVEEGCHPGK